MKPHAERPVRLGAVGLALIVAAAAHAEAPAAPGEVRPTRPCAELAKLQIPGSGMTITRGEAVPAAPAGTVKPSMMSTDPIAVPVPAYCRVEGEIDRRVGVDGKSYAIGFAIALPDEWNGRFLFQGGGGLNGSIQPPFGAAAAGEIPALVRGFAVVSTDSGHKGAVFDASFMKDQQASLDFAQSAVPRVAVLAKQIIAEYYGEPVRHSYFAGCSTGGREGMLVAERFPAYFDGVVSGAPAMRTGYSGIGMSWATVSFNRAAPQDAAGRPLASRTYGPADKKLLTQALLAACDGNDGLKDSMIFDVQGCRFDPSALACSGPKTETCLSAEQVRALVSAFAGPKDSRGRQVYPPYPYDTGMVTDAAAGPIPPFLPSDATGPFGPPDLSLTIDVDQREQAAADNQTQRLIDTAYWTNFTSFTGHGGKLIFYHGVSDPWFSAFDTAAFYERLAQDNGGMAKALDWTRFFFVPGMSHCGGGPATLDRFDLLTAVVDWVENGKAPDSVAATGKAFPGRSRPLCPYPSYARYKGKGDPEDAANFECRAGGSVR